MMVNREHFYPKNIDIVYKFNCISFNSRTQTIIQIFQTIIQIFQIIFKIFQIIFKITQNFHGLNI